MFLSKRVTQLLIATALFHTAAPWTIAETSSQSSLFDEIIVTATKREESIDTIPISMSVVSNQVLDDLNIENVSDLQTVVPNLSVFKVSGGSTSPILNIRGLLNRTRAATRDNAVGVYVDDVFLARGYSAVGELLDVSRVEVLRGPQGTLFGRSTIGGAIQVVTNTPDIGGELGGSAKLTAGNLELFQGKAVINVPFGEAHALRLAGSVAKDDGYTDTYLVDDTFDPLNGQFGYTDGVDPILEKIDTNNKDRYSMRLSYAWAPSDKSRLDLSWYRSESDTNGVLSTGQMGDLGGNIAGPTPFGRATTVDQSSVFGFYSTVTADRPFAKSNVELGILKYTHSFDVFDLKLIAAHARADQQELFHTDGIVTGAGMPLALEVIGDADSRVDQDSIELQLSGKHGKLDWIAGAYYFEENAEDRNTNGLRSIPAEIAASMIPSSAPIPALLLLFTSTSEIDVRADNTSAAVFGSVNYDVTESVTVRLGGRYTEDTKGFDGRTTRVSPLSPMPICIYTNQPVTTENPCRSFGILPDETDFQNVTWDISLDYQFTDDVFGYAKVGTGYRTGGVSISAIDQATATPFNEDTVLSYELGVKAGIGGVARVSLATFYVDYEDIQQSTNASGSLSCVETNATVAITCNIGDAVSKGIELGAVWQLSERFGIRADFGYTDFEFDESIQISAQPFTPEWSFALTAIYDRVYRNVPLRTLVSYQASDEWFSSPDATVADVAVNDGYALLDARITATFAGKYDVSIWGKNLADDEYYSMATSGSTPVILTSTGITGAPRTYGVDFTVNF